MKYMKIHFMKDAVSSEMVIEYEVSRISFREIKDKIANFRKLKMTASLVDSSYFYITVSKEGEVLY